jgi:multiple sugar transport system ATP-binding protein
LRLAPATNRNLTAEVCHLEALGNEQLLTCRLREGGQLLLVRAEADAAVALGQTVHLDVEPSGWRLFDAAGEALLGGPQAKPEREVLEPQLPRLG